jgi:hypothetical protein
MEEVQPNLPIEIPAGTQSGILLEELIGVVLVFGHNSTVRI